MEPEAPAPEPPAGGARAMALSRLRAVAQQIARAHASLQQAQAQQHAAVLGPAVDGGAAAAAAAPDDMPDLEAGLPLEAPAASQVTQATQAQGSPTEEDVARMEHSLRAFGRWLTNALPFLLLLVLLFIFQRCVGIFVFLVNMFILTGVNNVVVQQTALHERRNRGRLAAAAGVSAVHIACMYVVFKDEELWLHLAWLQPPVPVDFLGTLWVVVFNDAALALCGVATKALLLAVAAGSLRPRRVSVLLSTAEAALAMYRLLLPVRAWYVYFQSFMAGTGSMFPAVVTGLYLSCKWAPVIGQARLTATSLRAFVLRQLQFGKYATQVECASVDDTCSICQDTLQDAVVLRCSHVFCEECVARWFQREQTCPMCRATVPLAGTNTHADGSTSLLPTIC